MTEPRKTPRTDRYCESGFANYGAGYVNPAEFMRALEIETQELSEALEWILDASDNVDETGYIIDCGFVDMDKFHTEARALLARHRAKQEVQS